MSTLIINWAHKLSISNIIPTEKWLKILALETFEKLILH